MRLSLSRCEVRLRGIDPATRVSFVCNDMRLDSVLSLSPTGPVWWMTAEAITVGTQTAMASETVPILATAQRWKVPADKRDEVAEAVRLHLTPKTGSANAVGDALLVIDTPGVLAGLPGKVPGLVAPDR